MRWWLHRHVLRPSRGPAGYGSSDFWHEYGSSVPAGLKSGSKKCVELGADRPSFGGLKRRGEGLATRQKKGDGNLSPCNACSVAPSAVIVMMRTMPPLCPSRAIACDSVLAINLPRAQNYRMHYKPSKTNCWNIKNALSTL